MAEIVHQRIENRIPELEQLERVGLFSKKEVKSLLKRATALEYKLHRLIITKVDFIAYIQVSRIGYQFKREEIEFSIISRINNIFRRATTKWKDDVQLWLSHIAFCKKWNTKSAISKVFSSMLAIHPEKPVMHAYILRMVSTHTHTFLSFFFFWTGSLIVLFALQGGYEFSPEIVSGKLAEVVYRDATGKIQGADFILSLLTIATIFDFTKDLQDTIIQDLQSKYTDDSLTWDFMARRELEATVGEELQTAKGRASDIARKEERCCQVYEQSLNSLNTEAMWACYVSFCLERFKRKTDVRELKEKRQERLLAVLQRAHDSSLIETNRILGADRCGCHGSHPALQTICGRVVRLGSGATGKLFQDALTHVNPKSSLPLWQLQVEWSMTSQSPEETEALFQRGLLSVVPAVSMEIKEKYLDWSYRAGGYKKARKTFTSLHESRPFSKAFFTRMIQMEKDQETPKMSNLRDFYERALREFGSTDDDLWLEYIREELGPSGQPESCGKIHWRAMKLLEGESVERFTAQYTLLQTGHI
uniref:UTP6 small subunit processome component n=1 Tax=Oncorhynchus mykiss TaxID=8022 RepID=A0A8K9X537_ONCMY